MDAPHPKITFEDPISLLKEINEWMSVMQIDLNPISADELDCSTKDLRFWVRFWNSNNTYILEITFYAGDKIEFSSIANSLTSHLLEKNLISKVSQKDDRSQMEIQELISYHLSMLESNFEDIQIESSKYLLELSLILFAQEEMCKNIDKIINCLFSYSKQLRLYSAKILENLCELPDIEILSLKKIVKGIVINIDDSQIYKILGRIDGCIIKEVCKELEI